jgi:formylglycine-generating enzyme required for sulfatase activity
MKSGLCSIVFASLAVSSAMAEPLDIFRDCDVCPEMIELPLGEFVMGAPDDEFRQIVHYTNGKVNFATKDNPYIPENEGPQHKVTVDIPIAMGKNEVTFDEWMACVNDGGCNGYMPDETVGMAGTSEDIRRSITDPRFKRIPSEAEIAKVIDSPDFLRTGGRYPVNEVSYLDAMAYVAWLNKKLGTDAYRLPSEAEWEYAARAGTTTRFAQGYEPTSDQANISGSNTEAMLQEVRPDLRTLGHPVPVDELDAANPWGLRHMAGNLEEITLSCYPEDTKRLPGWATTSEWLEKSFGKSCKRVLRGGSYGDSMDRARAASRWPYPEEYEIDFLGFRVIKELE